jgi:hypothetical protein
MTRSVTHSVVLYSSLSDSLPAPINGLNWNAINYILNHKQGSMRQIQEAIWYFTNSFSPAITRTDAWAMISNSQPRISPGQGTLAVICYPGLVSPFKIDNRAPQSGHRLSQDTGNNVNVYNGAEASVSPHITRAQLEA